MRPPGVRILAAAFVAAVALAPAAPTAAAGVQPNGTDNYGRFFHVMPAGQNGTDTLLELAAFEANGTRPPHSEDQRDIYTNLLYATPGLTDDKIADLFPDATFGSKDTESTEVPRADVTIQRDGLGRPHIYGLTRSGLMFGAGYASAEDHLFMMDVLRNAGAGTTSNLAGGANRGMDEDTWTGGAYSDADRQKMLDNLAHNFGARGKQIVDDIGDYCTGVNAYIAKTRTDITLLPAEYPAALHPEGPAEWSPVDVLDVASLIGSQLGNGGGNELQQAEMLLADQKRFGARKGYRIWRDLRSVDDAEAPVTATAKKGFPYDVPPKKLGKTVALPDPGTLKYISPVIASTGAGTPPGQRLDTGAPAVDKALFRFPSTDSNALLVSAAHSNTGHPLAVFGSQAGYFSAEIWRYQDLHGPGIDVAGGNIPGTGPYVEIGHGPDYAWSATSASQDIIDVYATQLCEPGGGKPTVASRHYSYLGQCLAMEPLERQISWQPSAADSTPAGTETLRTYRTKIGLAVATATIKGVPVVYTKLRSTYMHELDSAVGFEQWNEPALMNSVTDFQHAAFGVGYTFNWFYTDDKDIGYINTGSNPVRPKFVNGLLPTWFSAKTKWKGFNADDNTATYQPYSQRPQAVNQPYLVSWNNKQAHHCCGNAAYTPVWRSMSLTDGIDNEFKAHGGKIGLANLVDAAEFGATVDLRGYKTLPWVLKMIGTPSDPKLRDAVSKLRQWIAKGAPRIDRNRDGHYDDSDAVRIADAWMQTLPKAVFEPRMGEDMFKLYDADLIPDIPNSFHSQLHAHLGSSWEDGWFGFIQKDVRSVLNPKKVRSRWSIRFCGNGHRAACKAALLASLAQALAMDPAKMYDDPTVAGKCGVMDAQACYDALSFRAVTGVTQPLIPWQNRPTQQQVVEVTAHRPR